MPDQQYVVSDRTCVKGEFLDADQAGHSRFLSISPSIMASGARHSQAPVALFVVVVEIDASNEAYVASLVPGLIESTPETIDLLVFFRRMGSCPWLPHTTLAEDIREGAPMHSQPVSLPRTEGGFNYCNESRCVIGNAYFVEIRMPQVVNVLCDESMVMRPRGQLCDLRGRVQDRIDDSIRGRFPGRAIDSAVCL
jgi:hypothetical protein